jgi:hypothetical protein
MSHSHMIYVRSRADVIIAHAPNTSDACATHVQHVKVSYCDTAIHREYLAEEQ